MDKDNAVMRRTRTVRATVSAGIAGATVIGLGAGVLPWWQVLALALPATGLAGWTGSRIGRIDGIRAARLEPGERVIGTYAVRPPYTEHTPPSPHEGTQYHLRVTSRGVEMWERAELLWKHPWPELRVIVDGPRLRIHHLGQEAGTMLLEQPGAVAEVRLAAQRHGVA
ncbi:hypothetical protein ACI2K4_31285 [Micromonospora sp. NPDC050397]|uniref:hypothetical protein n=1 Tax=Micromonospora sp. NPDC050397 TaxID=3364279 RepID=UPI00384D8B14